MKSISVPLTTDEDGVIRVADTRVTLDTIVTAFESGCTCEEIAQQYSALDLTDIYIVIAYYLAHQDEFVPYLADREAQSELVRTERPLAPGESNAEIRRRLLNRRNSGP